VPTPGEPFPKSPSGYRDSSTPPDILIRADVTYLRQDFSLMMRVKDARPWPDMQRFDFLVRTREVTAEEAADYDKQIAKQGMPPSHAAAQYALRELTGLQPMDTSPEAWRKLVNVR